MMKNFFLYFFSSWLKMCGIYLAFQSLYIFFLKGFNKSFFKKSFMKQKRKTKIGLKNKEHQPTTEPNLFFGIFVVFFY